MHERVKKIGRLWHLEIAYEDVRVSFTNTVLLEDIFP